MLGCELQIRCALSIEKYGILFSIFLLSPIMIKMPYHTKIIVIITVISFWGQPGLLSNAYR
jgi:hypothetical protein